MSDYEAFAPIHDAWAADMTEALFGWFDRRPFDEDSREFVWVARKPS